MYFYEIHEILTEEVFSAPQWIKIICYIFAPVLLAAGVGLSMMENSKGGLLLIVPVLFLIAVSMLMYTRLKLMVSDSGIKLLRGIKQYNFGWNDITKVDMIELGKFKTPKVIIYYSDRKLVLDRGFYLKQNFNRILALMEMKISPELFTEQYRDIRDQLI
ncbi:hypothetical protein QF044_001519 [Chryseobacterium sp. W4I1]|nr:hypothetical protein [Chryseobacterium sp. W4I1]